MIRLLREALALSDEPEVVVECRRCGFTLSSAAETCPECNGDEVVSLEL